MRIWLTCLALVPALALGNDLTRQECMAPDVRESMMKTAMNTRDAQQRGVTERSMLELAFEQEGAAFRASVIAAVSEVYSSDMPISSVADAMQIACYEAASQ